MQEAEWAVEVLKTSGKPVMATVCIGPDGDDHGVSPQECAIRLAKAGADVVGINCRFGPQECLKTIEMMRKGLRMANFSHIHLATQPFGYHTPDAPANGYHGMREFPFGTAPCSCVQMLLFCAVLGWFMPTVKTNNYFRWWAHDQNMTLYHLLPVWSSWVKSSGIAIDSCYPELPKKCGECIDLWCVYIGMRMCEMYELWAPPPDQVCRNCTMSFIAAA